MSQALTPLNGGQGAVTTTVSSGRRTVLSDQAIRLRNLYPQPTQWKINGRPIYKRLPSASETYQIDFFEDKSKGWVYIPYGEGIFGPSSLEVVASDDNRFIIIKGGSIVWEYGQIDLNPAVINCELVGLQSTRYLIGYQLFYDDASFDAQYAVEDFSLGGLELDVQASTDTTVGWRFPPGNAFTPSSEFWKNTDSFFPSYAQPSECFLSWKSPKYCAFSKILVRCPELSSYSSTASLSVKVDGSWYVTQEALPQTDDLSQYYEFNLDGPTFQEEWKISWDSLDMSVSEITVSGIVTLVRRPGTAISRSSLVAYPENSVPDFFTNSLGESVPLVLCVLAYVDVDDSSNVIKIDDVRDIVYRDYKPVADWLTRPQDEDFIDLYEQVRNYPQGWMNPETAMVGEYAKLENESIQLSNSPILGS